VSIIVETRGAKIGRCNICGDYGKLTDDHTPPKGCIRVGQVAIQHIVERLGTEKPNYKGRHSQNGVKYKTLCSQCNNGRLGANYDISFNSFVNTVGNFLRSSLVLPKAMTVRESPQKIMRSILGHIAAQGVDRYEKGAITEPLRDYFLDETLPLPTGFNIYYWVFPYKGQVLVRDCAFVDLRVKEPVAIWLAKFFPIAFMVTIDEPAGYSFNLPNLALWREYKIGDTVEIAVPLHSSIHQYWPEMPTETSVVVYGQEAIHARQLLRIQR
jgi:hypothetical protein